MTIEKYISLLTSSNLYLCRLDKFEDRWEGVWPRFFLNGVMAQLKELGVEEYDIRNIHKPWSFVSCWHSNNYESAAMWDLYSTKSSGVAIKTTVGRLRESILPGTQFMIGKVEYLDLESDPRSVELNLVVPALLKRMSFSHENEVRIIHINMGDVDGDIPVKPWPFVNLQVDLNSLLGEVYLSPIMPSWLVDSLIQVSSRFGLDESRFIQSKLYDDYVM